VRQREWESLVVDQLREDQATSRQQAERIERLEAAIDELRERLDSAGVEVERTAD
jgi:hypothetical protein